MKIFIAIILLLANIEPTFSNVDSTYSTKEKPTIVEELPEFPGGETALLKYLSEVEIPYELKGAKFNKQVRVRFVIDSLGYVENPEIVEGDNELLNRAALEHVMQMPRWEPGKQKGKPVRTMYSLPFRFYADDYYWKKREKLERKKAKRN